MSVERKYDGEYCQIHIDLSRASDGIKIFSKSGKDSTIDRIRLHRALRDSLKLDTADCRIKRLCILEGELLVCAMTPTSHSTGPNHSSS
jgi:DNA ligase-4